MQKPAWLKGTNLTRFDVLALAQYVWLPEYAKENQGILCEDVSVTASCVLGVGTAINAGQWFLVSISLLKKVSREGHTDDDDLANTR